MYLFSLADSRGGAQYEGYKDGYAITCPSVSQSEVKLAGGRVPLLPMMPWALPCLRYPRCAMSP